MSDPTVTTVSQGRTRGRLQRWRWPLIIAGPAVILLAVVIVLLMGGKSVSTDNAYIQVAKAPVAPSIGGRVIEVLVRENQVVRKGQVLLRLDARDLEASLEAAEAALAQAELDVRASRSAYDQETASVKAAQETLAYTAREAARQRQLVAAGVASRQDLDRAVHAADQARQQVTVAQEAAAEALAKLGGGPGSSGGHPSVLQARAALARARLNISYTRVVAPADGIVTRVDQTPVGSYLNPSQTAFWLLSGQPWVEANFKEDQLARMKVGQPVTIKVDAYPDAALAGRVASFSPGTGSAFSALPAQNATGNWVKVVQRLPVRIDFDKPPPGMAGRAGLSAHVKVDLRPRSGEGA